MFGKLDGDKGYIGKARHEKLLAKGMDLVTKVRKNMKPVLRSLFDQAILKRRSLIETVIDELKNLCQIEHTRHRSPVNFTVNLLGGIVAYCLMPNKPCLQVRMGGARKRSEPYPELRLTVRFLLGGMEPESIHCHSWFQSRETR